MTWDEYNKLFHDTQANLMAFAPLLQCDAVVIKMIERAVAAEREACANVAAWILKMPENDVSAAIRTRGEQ